VHNDGFDAHFAAGALDTQGDFAAIGDKNFFEHVMSLCVVISCVRRLLGAISDVRPENTEPEPSDFIGLNQARLA
jgi:hypothetical protein